MTIAVWARTNRKIRSYSWRLKWIGIHIFIILASCLVYIWLSIHSIQTGYQIANAMEVQKQLKERNYALRSQWAYLTSPHYLKPQAEKLGLKIPQSIVHLDEGN